MLKIIYLTFWAISVVANEARMASRLQHLQENNIPPPAAASTTSSSSKEIQEFGGSPVWPPPPVQHLTPPPEPPPPPLPKSLRNLLQLPPEEAIKVEAECGGVDSEGTEEGEGWCPRVYEGLTCWPATPPGTYAAVPCPPSLLTNSSNEASRYCGMDGRWEPEYADYLPCTTDEIFIQDEVMSSVNRTQDIEGDTTSLLETVIAARYQMCVQLMKSVPQPAEGGLFCPRTFDGWSCWNDTPAGNTAYSPCPYFITGFDHRRMAHKVCNEDGSWFRHPLTNISWSNYTTCIDLDDLMMRQLINTIYIAGYSVSLIALAISLVIFFHFRTLQCTRIRLHKNLFVSFIMNNILWIAWYMEVASKPETVFQNKTGCQVLHIFLHYFLVANYCWMFSEGLYLHTLLVVAFVSEERLMKWFYLLGWGAPGVIVTVYAAVRGSSSSDTQHCWIDESHYTLILSTPVCISILANLVFLINIVRVLVTKLRANHVAADTNGTRKAVRATLILIPLLGLHYVLMPFRPAPGSNGELVYQVVAALVSSFQGFCVALLFCFCNSEVTTAIKKKWQQYQFNHGSTRFTLSTACVLSVNGANGKGGGSLHGASALRRTFSRGNQHSLNQQRDTLETPGEGSPWANTRSIVMENPSMLMETRSVVEEDYFGSREDCIGDSQHTALVEMQAVGDGRNNVVVETHNYHKEEAEQETLADPPNIVVVEPDYCSLLDNGDMEGEDRGSGSSGDAGGAAAGRGGGEGGVLNPVGDAIESSEALELTAVKATVHQA